MKVVHYINRLLIVTSQVSSLRGHIIVLNHGGALSWIAGIKRVANLNMVQILALRLKYGVPMELAMLCQIPGVGAARAKKLYDVGITSISAVLGSPGIVRKVLGNTVGNGVLDSARDFVESDNAGAYWEVV